MYGVVIFFDEMVIGCLRYINKLRQFQNQNFKYFCEDLHQNLTGHRPQQENEPGNRTFIPEVVLYIMFWETSVLEQQESIPKEGNEEPSNEALEETKQDVREEEKRRQGESQAVLRRDSI